MTSETPTSYSIVAESKPSEVVRVCDEVLAKLKEKGFGKDDMFAVHLTLEEAFLNAVKHGNKMDPDKTVKVDYSVSQDKLEISVTDQGPGFKPDNVDDPRFGENLFKPGGRGLLLMNSYMDMVKYNEQGNSVYMVRYKEKPLQRRKSSVLDEDKD
ncbi:MAG: ATP-binding protein [Sedimentisphaerales bacterium]|nr:ATP-binding protein [Sedimentisphaerales bacterium]